MRYQDVVIRVTESALSDFFRTVRAVPAEKLEWSPLDEGRSVLDQAQEVAQAPAFFQMLIEKRAFPEFTPEQMEKAMKQRKSWKTIDECEEACRKHSDSFYNLVRDYPDEDLEVMINLPWGGGMVKSIADVMLFHYWNVLYHTGQVNYIQTLYGDKEMH